MRISLSLVESRKASRSASLRYGPKHDRTMQHKLPVRSLWTCKWTEPRKPLLRGKDVKRSWVSKRREIGSRLSSICIICGYLRPAMCLLTRYRLEDVHKSSMVEISAPEFQSRSKGTQTEPIFTRGRLGPMNHEYFRTNQQLESRVCQMPVRVRAGPPPGVLATEWAEWVYYDVYCPVSDSRTHADGNITPEWIVSQNTAHWDVTGMRSASGGPRLGPEDVSDPVLDGVA